MKIDTSFIRLSSERHFYQKKEIYMKELGKPHSFFHNSLWADRGELPGRPMAVSFQQEIKFSDLFESGLKSLAAQQAVLSNPLSGWGHRLKLERVESLDAVQLADAFVVELEKLRRILNEILEMLNSTGLNGFTINSSDIRMLHVFDSTGPAVQVFEYEKQQTTEISIQEHEQTSVYADGMVKTSDGRSIDLSLQMNLDREFFRQDQFTRTEKGYMMIDPLVINLGSSTPEISDVRIDFDLNADGLKENIPILEPGSFFLSLDKNKDKMINDGSELFGPSTQDGFGELGAYDVDQNLWIDENDPVFDELTLWGGDDQGQMRLTRLKDAGVGAIYLPHVASSFDFNDQDNHLAARLKKSGIALNEDGSVNTVQEMDWNV